MAIQVGDDSGGSVIDVNCDFPATNVHKSRKEEWPFVYITEVIYHLHLQPWFQLCYGGNWHEYLYDYIIECHKSFR